MTIVYLITTLGHGKGGHFHSLNTIANTVGVNNEVSVINIGYKPSEVLDEANYKLSFVSYNAYNFFSTYFKIKKLIKVINPVAIHAFDVESFAFSRILSRNRKQPSILNKCGGPNPKKYFPIANKLVLFSKENEAYFQNNKRYKNTEIALIPNRVRRVVIDQSRVDLFHKIYGKVDMSMLRIARIGKHYHKSIIQAINLIGWLKSKGTVIRLIVIGTIQNQDIYDSLLNYIKSKQLEDDVIIDTSDIFTHNASELLEIGDIIIGTGRNFMEASSLNKILLTPYKNSNYPLLVTNGNFQDIFKTNFSPRTEVTNFNETDNLSAIFKLLNNQKHATSSISWFNTYFNVENGVAQYVKLYQDQKLIGKNQLFDAAINMLYAFKTVVFKT